MEESTRVIGFFATRETSSLNIRPLKTLIAVSLCELLVLCVGCRLAGHAAFFFDVESGARITVELDPAHPYLAEYNRRLTIGKGRQFERRYQLSMDTGGYAAANLYRCSGSKLMLESYSEVIVMDTSTGDIHPGKCSGTPIYLGIFDGGGSKPWLFFPASQRHEMKL